MVYYQNTHTYTHPHITKPTHTHTHTLQNPHTHTEGKCIPYFSYKTELKKQIASHRHNLEENNVMYLALGCDYTMD